MQSVVYGSLANAFMIWQMTDKQRDNILALHNTAPFKLVRAAAPYFRVKDGEPRNIIQISSASGLQGNAYVQSLSHLPVWQADGSTVGKPTMRWQKQASQD